MIPPTEQTPLSSSGLSGRYRLDPEWAGGELKALISETGS